MTTWTSWGDFTDAESELATFGHRRLTRDVAYLGTVRQDGLPRVHPIEPIVTERRLAVFMFATSPKGHDLRRDGRYALHTTVADTAGSNGELLVRGHGRPCTDPAARAEAIEAGYQPKEEYVLFELSVEEALVTEYEDGQPRYRRFVTQD